MMDIQTNTTVLYIFEIVYTQRKSVIFVYKLRPLVLRDDFYDDDGMMMFLT